MSCHPSSGDKVVIVGGKYAGRRGLVMKVTKSMCAVRLSHNGDVVRVMTHNVELPNTVDRNEKEVIAKVEVCQRRCCQGNLEAVRTATKEIREMQARLDELVEKLERLSTT
jgi:ribosomal protein L24